MGAYKDKGGRWYVSVRYKNRLGEPSRKTKRGFTTKRDALAWEREFLQKFAGSLDMTFNSFYEIYRNDLQNRIRQNTWVTKSSIIEKKILPYFGDKRVRDVKPVDVLIDITYRYAHVFPSTQMEVVSKLNNVMICSDIIDE